MLTDLFFHDESFYQYCEKNYIDADWKEIRQIINCYERTLKVSQFTGICDTI